MAAARNHFPVPIAKMNPWAFWSLPRALDLAPEDIAALESGEATLEQQDRAVKAALAAREHMVTIRVSGLPDYSRRPC